MGNAGAGEKREIHVVPGELNNEERFSQIAGLTEQYQVLCIVRRGLPQACTFTVTSHQVARDYVPEWRSAGRCSQTQARAGVACPATMTGTA